MPMDLALEMQQAKAREEEVGEDAVVNSPLNTESMGVGALEGGAEEMTQADQAEARSQAKEEMDREGRADTRSQAESHHVRFTDTGDEDSLAWIMTHHHLNAPRSNTSDECLKDLSKKYVSSPSRVSPYTYHLRTLPLPRLLFFVVLFGGTLALPFVLYR